MIYLIQRCLRRGKNLHHSSRGTALTEFAISLPVFLIFLSGILTLFDLQQQALFTHQESISEFWEDAYSTQTDGLVAGSFDTISSVASGDGSLGNLPNAPGVGGGTASVVDYYSDMNESTTGFSTDSLDFSGLMDNAPPLIDHLSSAGGIHGDSYLKTKPFQLAQLTPSTWSDENWPQDNVESLSDGDSNALGLMQDRLGAPRPTLAAGLRYGVSSGTAEREQIINDSMRSLKATSLTGYNASAPPFPSPRLAPVFFSYWNVRTTDGYDNMIEFGYSRIGTGSTDAGSVDRAPSDQELEECQKEVEEYYDRSISRAFKSRPDCIDESDVGDADDILDQFTDIDDIEDIDFSEDGTDLESLDGK